MPAAGAALVGVTDVEFLRWPDGTVTGGIELRRAIAGVVRRRRPEMVLTMTFETGAGGSVNHADHRAVGLATIDAVRDAANRWVFPELGAAWSGVQATYAFGASEPTHFVDVSETMDAAVQSRRPINDPGWAIVRPEYESQPAATTQTTRQRQQNYVFRGK